MRKTYPYFSGICKYAVLTLCCLLISCAQPGKKTIPDENRLALYAEQSSVTDPGDYIYLYDALPESMDSLCFLIKRQLIHPMEALQMGYSIEQVIEEGAIDNTERILEALVKKDSTGLNFERLPDDRLLIACHHHAMLLTSILRTRNIPVRMRFGFARYFERDMGVRFGHIICEVWNENEKRWMLVDPDRQYVDFSPERFDFADEAWNNLLKDRIDQDVYISSIGDGLQGVVNLLALDAAHIIHEERIHWIYPDVALKEIRSFEDLDENDMHALDEAAGLLKDPDLHFTLIDSLYRHHKSFQQSDMDYEDYCRMMEERYN